LSVGQKIAGRLRRHRKCLARYVKSLKPPGFRPTALRMAANNLARLPRLLAA